MNMNIQSVKFDADKKLLDFVEMKLSKISKFSDKITNADIILKIDKDADAGNKVVVMEIHVPGDILISERRSKSFEESVDECVDAIKKQLIKYKEKHKLD